MPGPQCSVVGCTNGFYRLERWKAERCTIHQLHNDKCPCPPPFKLYNFPTQIKYPEARKRWIKMVNRIHDSGQMWQPTSHSRICSVHFPSGKPTPEYPDPCLELGYSLSRCVSNLKKRTSTSAQLIVRPPKKKLLLERTTTFNDAAIQRQDGTDIWVGDRICTDGFYGTIKFIGPVPSTKGIWLGVDWDVDTRGKHNGTKDGIRYFHTRNATSGSFIRPDKVNTGMACLSAIKDRYGKIDDGTAGVREEDLFLLDEKNKQITIEMVGAEKVNDLQSQFHRLKKVILRDLCVYGCGPYDIADVTPNISDLDLSLNLFSNWLEIAKISQQLPHLTTLNVSDNRLPAYESPHDLTDSFRYLDSITMNFMQYSWLEVLQCTLMFPHLLTLHACFNDITELSPPSMAHLQHVQLINLEGNRITNWVEVLHIGHLPQLQHLILSSNGLSSITFPDAAPQSKTSYFPSLNELSLNDNSLCDWSVINELNKLQSLSNLRLSKNPLNASSTPEDVRSRMIAKIGNLHSLNRTSIDPLERRGAEYEYVKAHYTEWKEAGGDVDATLDKTNGEFIMSHPRLDALVRCDDIDIAERSEAIKDRVESQILAKMVHGEPEKGELVKVKHTIRDNLISVNISDGNKIFKKKLSLGMSVQKLVNILQKLYKNDVDEIHLSYCTQEVPDTEFQIDNMMRDLSFYSIENGDTIMVRFHPFRIRRWRPRRL